MALIFYSIRSCNYSYHDWLNFFSYRLIPMKKKQMDTSIHRSFKYTLASRANLQFIFLQTWPRTLASEMPVSLEWKTLPISRRQMPNFYRVDIIVVGVGVVVGVVDVLTKSRFDHVFAKQFRFKVRFQLFPWVKVTWQSKFVQCQHTQIDIRNNLICAA